MKISSPVLAVVLAAAGALELFALGPAGSALGPVDKLAVVMPVGPSACRENEESGPRIVQAGFFISVTVAQKAMITRAVLNARGKCGEEKPGWYGAACTIGEVKAIMAVVKKETGYTPSSWYLKEIGKCSQVDGFYQGGCVDKVTAVMLTDLSKL